ncbi:anthranilate synthase component I family protein, partial [Inquilinus limosus]|uniref:anthranilate synthase component I family protein n=1 Tax=Inquilinus limosus TaxID=171674 RepID=UPI003D2EEA0E
GVRRIRDWITAGDIYQANLTQRFLADLPDGLDPFTLHRRLRALSPAPFAAFLDLGEGRWIASASPERFLAVDPAGRVETRPIKGTRPRGVDAAADAVLAVELQASTKDRAENLMIVDLLRNDLSKVCAVGSVRVPALCGLETFPRVHHLVSVVEGRLAPGRGAVDLLRACFPGGSITGAPKIRAMEIIRALEPARRGPYCGSVVHLGFDGSMDSSIIIRTLCGAQGQVAAQAGGGIVYDSDPDAEYDEAMVKVRPLLQALAEPPDALAERAADIGRGGTDRSGRSRLHPRRRAVRDHPGPRRRRGLAGPAPGAPGRRPRGARHPGALRRRRPGRGLRGGDRGRRDRGRRAAPDRQPRRRASRRAAASLSRADRAD